jgi:hypothetical protein
MRCAALEIQLIAFTTQEEFGRIIARGRHGNAEVRVVSAYDPTTDSYVTHVYVTPAGSPERKLHAYSGPGYNSVEAAFSAGFAGAEQAIGTGTY